MLKPPTPPPTAHQPPEQFKAKPESKSWNKVVSGGQNKQQQFPPTSNVMHSAGNRAPAMTTTTAIRAAPPAIVENNSAKSHVPPPPIQATSTVQKPSSPESVVSPNQNPQYNGWCFFKWNGNANLVKPYQKNFSRKTRKKKWNCFPIFFILIISIKVLKAPFLS